MYENGGIMGASAITEKNMGSFMGMAGQIIFCCVIFLYFRELIRKLFLDPDLFLRDPFTRCTRSGVLLAGRCPFRWPPQ